MAIIGGGGIGVDTAIYLSHGESEEEDLVDYLKRWGIDENMDRPGGVKTSSPRPKLTPRQIYLLQRKGGKVGANIGKTTVWIHRLELDRKQVQVLNRVTYERIDDQGLHIRRRNESVCLDVDNVVICAGQEPVNDLAKELAAGGIATHTIGGARQTQGLDAKRAIAEGFELAMRIE